MYNFKVKYKIIDYERFAKAQNRSKTEINLRKYIHESIGEVIEFIPGNQATGDKFLICDDKTKKFIKVNIENCKKI